jgi:peptidase M50B-like protein
MATIWDPVDMEKAAFHEAGHAVVAWSLCLTVDHVELDVANNSGHARIADAEDAVHRVAVSYAGFEAEDMFKGPAAFVRAEDDFTRADEELTKGLRQQFKKGLYPPEGRALQIACRTCAQDWLRMHEAKVRRVAERLLQPPHKIDGATFEQLMREG